MSVKLKGFVSFWRDDDGQYFMSDSYPTELECRSKYRVADIDGYIDLSKIPEDAIKSVKP